MRTPPADSRMGPVVTFGVNGAWLGIRIAQLERVVRADDLVAVPLSRQAYLGLLEVERELIPVLSLAEAQASRGTWHERLVVILHVRGDSVGMAVDKAGHLCAAYDLMPGTAPPLIGAAAIGRGTAPNADFWLIDTDRLWDHVPDAARAASA